MWERRWRLRVGRLPTDRPQRPPMLRAIPPLLAAAALFSAAALAAPDYTKRAQALEPAVKTRLLGRWTNPVDGLIIEISAVDLASGQIRGKLSPTSGPAAANEHELIGWVSAATVRDGYDYVTPVTFSTTLYEYGTLPVWAGY